MIVYAIDHVVQDRQRLHTYFAFNGEYGVSHPGHRFNEHIACITGTDETLLVRRPLTFDLLLTSTM